MVATYFLTVKTLFTQSRDCLLVCKDWQNWYICNLLSNIIKLTCGEVFATDVHIFIYLYFYCTFTLCGSKENHKCFIVFRYDATNCLKLALKRGRSCSEDRKVTDACSFLLRTRVFLHCNTSAEIFSVNILHLFSLQYQLSMNNMFWLYLGS